MRRLPEEILLKILRLLPFRSIHACMWVSKSWLNLISNFILPKPIPAADLRCIVCRDEKGAAFLRDDDGAADIDIDLSFLPIGKLYKGPTVIDCSNGLILCTVGSPAYSEAFYVCNPATKSWTVLPIRAEKRTWPRFFNPAFLGFKPWASPHFTVLAVHRGREHWSLYSSRTRKWSKTRLLGGGHVWPWSDADVTMSHGDFYAVYRRRIRDGNCMRVRVETVRLCLAQEKEEAISFPEIANKLIVFPDSKIQPDTYIGRLGDEVCFALVTGLGLTVWRLEGTEWALKHASNIVALRNLEMEPLVGKYGFMHKPCTRAFWMPNSVYLFYHDAAYLYDLDTMTLEDGRPLLQRHSTRLFPFSSFEVFVDRDEMAITGG